MGFEAKTGRLQKCCRRLPCNLDTVTLVKVSRNTAFGEYGRASRVEYWHFLYICGQFYWWHYQTWLTRAMNPVNASYSIPRVSHICTYSSDCLGKIKRPQSSANYSYGALEILSSEKHSLPDHVCRHIPGRIDSLIVHHFHILVTYYENKTVDAEWSVWKGVCS